MHGNEVALRNEAAVRRWFSARVPPEDAEDLTQDVMVAIIRSWSGFRNQSSERTWVYAICRNTLYNSRRSRKTSMHLEEHMLVAEDDHGRTLEIRVAVNALPHRLRVLYRLRYKEGLPVREVAARLGRSEGTVKYQFYEMRSCLARLLR